MLPKTFIQNILGSWLIFTAAILPFPYALFPSFKFAASDSILLYELALATLILAIITNSVLLFFSNLNPKQTSIYLKTISTYILAYFLLKYGVDKLFQNQFYAPEPNTLHTPIGQLTKDIVFWTSMSSSFGYNLFMGIIETITALFLFHPKTRLIGLITSLGITINILMINIGFDITVKFLSGYLVLLTIYLLSFYGRLLYQALVLQTTVSHNSESAKTESTKLGRLIKGSVIGLLILDCILPFVNPVRPNESEHMLGKTYEIISSEKDGIWDGNVRHIHFHTKGYLITEDDSQHFEDYRIRTSPIQSTITFVDEKITMKYTFNSDTLVLTTQNADESKTVKLIPMDNTALPLLEDTFHWTYEGFID